jgi:GNAT superfamily N-acetyltransferase
VTLRRAGPADIDALVALRVEMERRYNGDRADEPEWQQDCRETLRERFRRSDDFAAFVVEQDDQVVSGGVGWVEQHLPGPNNRSGRRGHVGSMCTLPAYRRRGYARAVLTALLEWFTSIGVQRVDLRAAADGEPLYRSVGFSEGLAPTLTLTIGPPTRPPP